MTIASDIVKIMGKDREAVRHCITIAANDRATIEEKLGGVERCTFADGSWIEILMYKLEILSYS